MIDIGQDTEQYPQVAGRGFAGWTREQHREASSRGGKATQARGTGHRFTSETGAAAGRIGGKVKRVRRRAQERER